MFTGNSATESAVTASNGSTCLSAESARARLAHDVRVALRRAGHNELRTVEVEVDSTRITITGRVTSYYLKALSQELARRVAPRYRVCNELKVAAHPILVARPVS